MNNFEYCNPTRILFGKGKIADIAREIPADAKVLARHRGARERGLPAAPSGEPVTGDELRVLLAGYREKLRTVLRRADP